MKMKKLGILLLGLAVVLPLTIRADQDGDRRDWRDRDVCRDDSDHHEHNLRTPLKLIGVVPVPGNPIISADIAWVDPGTERYYLADRSNKGVDIVNTETGFYEARVGGMVGVVGAADGTTANNGSGPNGVVVTPNRHVWAGDGNDTLVAADVDPDSPTYLKSLFIGSSGPLGGINLAVTDKTSPSFCDNGAANGHWCGRADEIGYDPRHHIILIATPGPLSPTMICATPTNPKAHCAVEPYANLVSADPPYSILFPVISFANAGGLEQPVWDPGLSRFWLTVPGFPNMTSSPRIVRINPKTGLVDKTITINCTAPPPAGLGLAVNNPSTTGIALAPFQHLLVSACGYPVDVNAISGSAKLITSKVGGGDEVWYNSGDGRFYVTGRDKPSPPSTQLLGVIDAQNDKLLQLIPVSAGPIPPALTSGRNPAASAENNRVFVFIPVNAAIVAAPSTDDSLCTKFGVVGRGCIAVFAHSGDEEDDK
jgi:hypothetical protein